MAGHLDLLGYRYGMTSGSVMVEDMGLVVDLPRVLLFDMLSLHIYVRRYRIGNRSDRECVKLKQGDVMSSS